MIKLKNSIFLHFLFASGIKGFNLLIQLWFGYTSGIPTNDVEIMMNWRMIGLNMSPYLGSVISWAVAGIGMAITFAFAIYIWILPIDQTSPLFVFALFGTFAATNALSWHSHLESATILIPPLIYLLYKTDLVRRSLFTAWIFIPPIFRFFVFILTILVQENILSTHFTGLINFLTAISLFALNIYILIWVATQIHKSEAIGSRLST